LAGANKASKEAIRPLLALFKKTYGSDFKLDEFMWLLERIETTSNNNPKLKTQNLKLISEQLDKGINCVKTSSLGRVFDAVAAMLSLGSYNHFDAQLPMALEAIAPDGIDEYYDFELTNRTDEPVQLDLSKMFRQLVDDVKKEQDASIISAKFHNTLVISLLAMAKQARESTKLNSVALSGGVFCNRYLTNRLIKQLRQEGFQVFFNREVPSNDGGLSIGQAAIATYLVKHEA